MFPLFQRLTGLNLSYRVIFAIPVWLVPGLAVGLGLVRLRSLRSSWARFGVLAAVALVVALWGWNVANQYGFTGRLTYQGSDGQSQLALFPDLYEALAHTLAMWS